MKGNPPSSSPTKHRNTRAKSSSCTRYPQRVGSLHAARSDETAFGTRTQDLSTLKLLSNRHCYPAYHLLLD